jgi:iron complex transport system permease protein
MSPARASKQNRGLPAHLFRVCGFLLILLVAISVLSAGIGAVQVSPSTVARVALNHLPFVRNAAHFPVDDLDNHIVWDMHIPRILLGALVGISLAISGAALQGLLLNPLADPYMIGVSSGAAVGAGAAALLGVAVAFTPFFAFASALIAVSAVYLLSKRGRSVSILSFVLAGVVVGAFMWAALTLILTLAPNQTLEKVVFWTMGSLAGSDPWSRVHLLVLFTLFGFLILCAFARDLNIFALGEESATYLGLSVESLKRIIIVTTTLITAAAVSVSGTIGFVGLMVPHIARRIVGPDNRILIPVSALLGAILMIVADSVARGATPPNEIPVGVITALIGAPFFLYLLKITDWEN